LQWCKIPSISLFRHEHIFQNTQPHECIQCGFKSFKRFHLEKHMKSSGPYHNNQCSQCPEMFKTHQDYAEHVKMCHNGKWMFKCGQCDASQVLFEKKTDLRKHQREHHGFWFTPQKSEKEKARHVCDICGKAVSNAETHWRNVHDDTDENLTCPQCGKRFQKSQKMSDHIRNVHTKITCELCGMVMAAKQRKRHFQQHHMDESERKFKCDICGKGFMESSKLKDHINIHTGAKPHLCRFCGKGFANRGTQKMHERGHMGYKRSKN
jgi:KRAB domain-containing zinc finger protein